MSDLGSRTRYDGNNWDSGRRPGRYSGGGGGPGFKRQSSPPPPPPNPPRRRKLSGASAVPDSARPWHSGPDFLARAGQPPCVRGNSAWPPGSWYGRGNDEDDAGVQADDQAFPTSRDGPVSRFPSLSAAETRFWVPGSFHPGSSSADPGYWVPGHFSRGSRDYWLHKDSGRTRSRSRSRSPPSLPPPPPPPPPPSPPPPRSHSPSLSGDWRRASREQYSSDWRRAQGEEVEGAGRQLAPTRSPPLAGARGQDKMGHDLVDNLPDVFHWIVSLYNRHATQRTEASERRMVDRARQGQVDLSRPVYLCVRFSVSNVTVRFPEDADRVFLDAATGRWEVEGRHLSMTADNPWVRMADKVRRELHCQVRSMEKRWNGRNQSHELNVNLHLPVGENTMATLRRLDAEHRAVVKVAAAAAAAI